MINVVLRMLHGPGLSSTEQALRVPVPRLTRGGMLHNCLSMPSMAHIPLVYAQFVCGSGVAINSRSSQRSALKIKRLTDL